MWCYYLLTGRLDMARHFFRRGLVLDPLMAECWVRALLTDPHKHTHTRITDAHARNNTHFVDGSFWRHQVGCAHAFAMQVVDGFFFWRHQVGCAHAFAMQGEHDQAMAAYRSASRICGNSHIPALCIGTEYLRVNNTELAQHFIASALQQCPADPLIYNERGESVLLPHALAQGVWNTHTHTHARTCSGVAHYKNGQYADALDCFLRVDELVGCVLVCGCVCA